MTVAIALLVLLALAAGFFYWLLVTTEGAYLGPRAVAFLYDRGAGSYDRVKEFDAVDDAWNLALPLTKALRGVKRPLILDVGTGTGRVPLALLRDLDFDGRIVGLDRSLGMLKEARRKTAGSAERVMLVWKDAMALPFLDETFHAVSCVEALEFMADPRVVIEEMARVLRRGGTLLTTNRVGLDALLMPGRSFSPGRLRQLLSSSGFTSVEIKTWQTYYDLVWARKDGPWSSEGSGRDLQDVLRCPRCSEDSLTGTRVALSCHNCGSRYAVDKGITYLEGPLEK